MHAVVDHRPTLSQFFLKSLGSVVMASFRGRLVPGGARRRRVVVAEDGIKSDLWAAVVGMTQASRDGDMDGFRRYSQVLSGAEFVGLTYARLLLGLVIADRLGVGRPAPAQLEPLVEEVAPHLERLGFYYPRGAADTFNMIYGYDDVDHLAQSGTMILLYSAAIAGALSDDPTRTAARMRPLVAEICAKHYANDPTLYAPLRSS